MHPDNAFGNGQAQTSAACLGSVGIRDAIKGKEDFSKMDHGHSRTVIAHLDHGSRNSSSLQPAHGDFHICAGPCVPNRIANDIFNSSTLVLGYACGGALVQGIDSDRAGPGLSLEISIGCNFLQQAAQLNGFLVARFGTAVDSSQREELSD
jgi:hypothetical protein